MGLVIVSGPRGNAVPLLRATTGFTGPIPRIPSIVPRVDSRDEPHESFDDGQAASAVLLTGLQVRPYRMQTFHRSGLGEWVREIDTPGPPGVRLPFLVHSLG